MTGGFGAGRLWGRGPVAVVAGLVLATAIAGVPERAEEEAGLGAPSPDPHQDFLNVPYDGSYTFVRVRFNGFRNRGFGGGFGRGGGPGWAHDYPYADNNFIRILDEITILGPNTVGTNIIDADDPDLLRYPIAYISEPGEWSPTRAEVENVAAYLRKGGFLILDDFRGNGEWRNVEAIFGAILPGHRFRLLELEEPVFNSFFEIETLELPPPTFGQYRPLFLGLHEHDDPDGRLMVIANFNNDIGDYWEYSDMGYYPIDLSNEAYKFGVNYIIYAMNR